MRLDRSSNPDGKQKYALIHWRKFKAHMACADCHPQLKEETGRAFELLLNRKIAEHGDHFFVLKYKDQFAKPAFRAYVHAVDAHVRWLEHKTQVPGDADFMPEDEVKRQLEELRPYLADLIVELSRMQAIPSGLPT